jgi:hypothetical protein
VYGAEDAVVAVLPECAHFGEAGTQDTPTILAQQTIAECDRKLVRYRAALEALDAEVDPAIVAGWISETQNQRQAAQAQLRHAPSRNT